MMAFEKYDFRGFLFLVIFAIPMVASRNIDCHGRGFHCVNSTHFMICVDLGFGVSTTIDDFIIPCPPTTVCHKHNIFECEFPKFEITTPPLQVIGVSEQSDTSETSLVSTSATSAPLMKVPSVKNKPVSILSTPEEITPIPELKVLNFFKDTDAYNKTSTKVDVTIQTTPNSVISEKVKLDDFVTKYDKNVGVSIVPSTVINEPTVETTLDKAVTVSVPDISIPIDTTTYAKGLLLITSRTPSPVESASLDVENSYRKDNGIINQLNDNNTLSQYDKGFNLISDFTTTEKVQVYNSNNSFISDIVSKSATSVANSQTSTETIFIISEANVTKTTEMTPIHENVYTESKITENSTVTSSTTSLPTTDKLADSDSILVHRTVDTTNINKNKQESSVTTTSKNLGFSNKPSINFEISHTVFNLTTNDAFNETSATTVSFNVSGVFEHSFVNNGLITPTRHNVAQNSITIENVKDQIQVDYLPNDNKNAPIENIIANQENVDQRVLETHVAKNNDDKFTEQVQDTVNPLTIKLITGESIPKKDVMGNETAVIRTSDSFNSTQIQNKITNRNVETKQSKPTLLVSHWHADNFASDILNTTVSNVSVNKNANDSDVEIIKNINITHKESKNENKLQPDLTDNNKTKLVTNQDKKNIQKQGLATPNKVSNTVDSKIDEPTSNSPNRTENVSILNSTVVHTAEVAELITQDKVNNTVNSIEVNSINATLGPTVKTYIGDNTTPMSILRTANSSEDLQLNSTTHQFSIHAILLVNITESTILKDYNTVAEQNFAIKSNTDTEYKPEVSIIQNVTNNTPLNNSRRSLTVNVLNNTAATTVLIPNSAPTTTSLIQNVVLPLNNDNSLNETTAPLSKTVIESQTVPYETTTIFPVLLGTEANTVTQFVLASAANTKSPFVDALRETKLDDKIKYFNPSTEPSVDFHTPKTVIVEELRHGKDPNLKQFEKTGPALHFEDVTTSVKNVTSISVTTESIPTNLLDKNLNNLTVTQGSDLNMASNNILREEDKLINTDTNAATHLNINNSRNGEAMTSDLSIESTTSVTTTPRIYLQQVTSQSTTPQTKNTSTQTALLIEDVPKILDIEINQTSSSLLHDAIKSATIQGPIIYTTTVRSTTIEEITQNQKPILMASEKVKDEMENTTKQPTKTTSIIESNKQLPLIKDVTGRSTSVYDDLKNSLSPLKIMEISTEPQTANTAPIFKSTVIFNDASWSTEQPLNQSSGNIYNTLAFNEVTTQQVSNLVTPLDSIVETIQVSSGQASETSHLGLVHNDTVIINQTVAKNNGKQIDREYIENVTSIKNGEDEATFNFTKLNNIDEKIQAEQYLTLNDANIDANKTLDIFSKKEDAYKYLKLASELQNKGLSTESPVNVLLPHVHPSTNTVEFEKSAIRTTRTYAVDQYLLQQNRTDKGSSEILSPGNNTDMNLEKNPVNLVKPSITNLLQNYQTTFNNQEVNLEKHNNTQINETGNELKPKTTKTSDFKPTVTSKQLQASNKDKNITKPIAISFNCANHIRGKYADKKDCRKFYTCVGNLQPLEGICPNNTVFSDINKQCTKNLSHCVSNNQFRCLLEGRFIDFVKDNIYYICIKNKQNKFLRYKFQCNTDYHLNKISVKCEKNAKNSSQTASSISENSQVCVLTSDESLSGLKIETRKTYNTKFECEDEGTFSHSNDCSKYYECTKVKDVYRRKLKKCAGDEVYDKEKKKCVKSVSTEC